MPNCPNCNQPLTQAYLDERQRIDHWNRFHGEIPPIPPEFTYPNTATSDYYRCLNPECNIIGMHITPEGITQIERTDNKHSHLLNNYKQWRPECAGCTVTVPCPTGGVKYKWNGSKCVPDYMP